MQELKHIPVMLNECIEGLNVKSDGIYFDGTLGGGGHSEEILKRLKTGRLIATDLDTDAIQRAKERLKDYLNKLTIVNDNFKNFSKILNNLHITELDGIILDLGVSSFQLDDRDRGFSYMADKPLDMRMDKSQKFSAKNVINEYSKKELEDIIFNYGDERFSRKIAENIVKRRNVKPIETTGELVQIIEESIPMKFKQNGHPAKKTFQAIRIEVNGELDNLKETVIEMAKRLKKGGRMAVITFHSLEDRAVKQAFKDLETDCICDKSLPICVCGKRKEAEIITKRPIEASEEEIENNSRSKSAKLRILERV